MEPELGSITWFRQNYPLENQLVNEIVKHANQLFSAVTFAAIASSKYSSISLRTNSYHRKYDPSTFPISPGDRTEFPYVFFIPDRINKYLQKEVNKFSRRKEYLVFID